MLICPMKVNFHIKKPTIKNIDPVDTAFKESLNDLLQNYGNFYLETFQID